MQALILGKHVQQRSLRLFQGYRDGAITTEPLTQLSHPGLYRFHFVFQFAAFALRRADGLQTPRMLLIRPIDPHERSKLGLLRLLTNFAFWHCFYSSSFPNGIGQRRSCFRETLIVESCCFRFRRHLSVRFGSKARVPLLESLS